MNKPILVVSGEPFSVFNEIFIKSLNSVEVKKIKKPIILIGSYDVLLSQMNKMNFKYSINLINKDKIKFNQLSTKKINLINVNFKFSKTFDKISNKSNSYIAECFATALNLLKKKNYMGLINGPISKKHFLKKNFLGITEYLSYKTKRKNKVAMLIYNKRLSVSPITTHLAIKNVHKNISKKKIITQVKLIKNFYKTQFKKNVNIAMTGLNPHCESNYQSSEEKNIILPAIKYLIKNKIKIKGPFAADTLFMKNESKKYDVIIGMYHDQVLTPAKTLFGFNAINITLGLPFIRISPDHGPNEKMLGKKKSNPKSLIEAFKFLDK